MSVKELKAITPTFQGILNKQIGKAMDAIDEGELFKAYSIMKTLIDALKPEHRDELLKNDVAHIETQLSKARTLKSVDWFQTARTRTKTEARILQINIRPLFRRIMTKLHEGGYLELYRQYDKGISHTMEE